MRIFLVLVVLSLSAYVGCRKSPESYGNFAKIESADLVQDTLGILLSAYPPAKTRLNLLHSTNDYFGIRLVESLRGNGYAIAECASPGKGGKTSGSLAAMPGLDFAYILDYLKDGDGLRVTLYIGDETVSRLYAANGLPESIGHTQAGIWMRKREGDFHGGQ